MGTDRSTRICVIGAGAAGITAAATLREQGYSHVTILEKTDRVGGKCRTVTENGVPLDLGAIFMLPNYPVVRRFIARTGLSVRKETPFIHIGVDGRTRPYGRPPAPYPLWERTTEFLRIGLHFAKYHRLMKAGGGLGNIGFSLSRDLSLPYREWVKKYRLDYFHQVAFPMLRAFGFGYEEWDIPAIYILQCLPAFARGGNPLTLWDVSKVDLFRLEKGYGELWRCVASAMNVRLNVQISRVERRENGGVVHTNTGPVEFDRLILTCPLDGSLAFLDASAEERTLFAKIQSLEVFNLSVRVDGFGSGALLDRFASVASLGHAPIYLRQHPESNWYCFFGYTGTLSNQDIQQRCEQDIRDLGGRTKGDVVFARWPYFPHYATQEVSEGYHVRLEKLQGCRSTYYAGEIMSSFGVENVAAYSERLVKQHF